MIYRDLRIRCLDGTTNTLQDITTDYTFILPPLWPWAVSITERICVVLEPTEGTLDNPTPNAFVSAIPPSWTSGNDFTITLIQQDWEVEGFAVNDRVFMLITQNLFAIPPRYIGVIATIRSILGSSATFRIFTAIVSGALNLQDPVGLACFLLDETNVVEGALHTGTNSGDTSPLSGLPFMQPHANALLSSSFASNTLPALTHNLRFYGSIGETLCDSMFPGLQPRRFREYTHSLIGTQFYAYRTNLDPTAQSPTNLYPLNGKIDISIKKRSVVRSFDLTFNCLLLHPNRVENTNVFLQPGVLTISGGSGTLTPPAGFTPQRSRICLLGSDTHHSSESISNSVELTSPTAPPSLPPARQGAYYVGVMVGQTAAGRWVAVMTNKEETIQPTLGVFTVKPPLTPVYRYDGLIGMLHDYTEFPGTYVIQTLMKVNDVFVPINEIVYTTDNVVSSPFWGNPYFASLSNIYPYVLWGNPVLGVPAGFAGLNSDFVIPATAVDTPFEAPPRFLVFAITLPSPRKPPVIPYSVTAPTGEYGLDLINWKGGDIVLKWRLFLPSGAVFESNPITFGDGSTSTLNIFKPDNQESLVAETPTFVVVFRFYASVTPTKPQVITTIRAAVFTLPEDYKPVKQSILIANEDINNNTVLSYYEELAPGLFIARIPFVLGTYVIVLNKTMLPPGRYTLHVRHSVVDTRVAPAFERESLIEESFFYDFVVPSVPINQPSEPLSKKACDPNTPALPNEPWDYIYIDNTGNWQKVSTNITSCKLENYCACFNIVPIIPKDYIDIIAYFKGSIFGLEIPENAKHKARFIGKIIRIDDEYETEDFVTSTYKKESIVRAYSEKYEAELLIHNPCEMSHIDLIKFAERCDVINRNNYILNDIIYDLKPEDISITNEQTHAKVRITFSKLTWRYEYRRQG